MKNTYDLSNEYGVGYTSKNEMFFFDKEDYDFISKYTWSSSKGGYLYNAVLNTTLHRYIASRYIKLFSDTCIDHRNRNPLDNRKENLFITTQEKNTINHSLRKDNKCGFTGISFYPKYNKWRATIVKDKKQKHLGMFAEKTDAIKARLKAELELFGKDLAPQRHLFDKYGIE